MNVMANKDAQSVAVIILRKNKNLIASANEFSSIVILHIDAIAKLG